MRIVVLTVCLAAALPIASRAEVCFYDCRDHHGFRVGVITDAQLATSSAFVRRMLSREQAVRLADVARKKVVDETDAIYWKMTSAKVEVDPRGCRYWMVKYDMETRPGVNLMGMRGFVNIAVLMDGRVVTPTRLVRPTPPTD